MKRFGSSTFGLLVLFVFWAGTCFAQVPSNNPIDEIGFQFANNASAWSGILKDYARRLFWILVGISFVVQASRLVLRAGDIGDFLEFITSRCLTIGFFALLLENSNEWAQIVVDSFRVAGSEASQAAGGIGVISPSNVFDAGVRFAGLILQEVSFWSPGSSFGLLVSGMIIVIVFALIAAEMLFLIVQMHIVVNAGVILAGFGGSHWTESIAVNFLRTALSIGLQLFLMQLVVGLGQSLFLQWVVDFEQNNSQVLTMIGVAIVFLVLATKIPAIASAMVQGSVGQGGLTATGVVAGAATGAAMGGRAARAGISQGIGGAVLAYEFARAGAASTGGQSHGGAGSSGSGQSSGTSSDAGFSSSSAKSQSMSSDMKSMGRPSWFKSTPLTRAVGKEYHERLSGQASPRGTMMGHLAGHMREERLGKGGQSNIIKPDLSKNKAGDNND